MDKNHPLFEFVLKLIEAIGDNVEPNYIITNGDVIKGDGAITRPTTEGGDLIIGDGATTRPTTEGGDFIQGNYINMSQDLTQAAAQIQELIEQLQKKGGVTVEVAKKEVAEDLAKQAKSNERIREKLIKWKESLPTIKWGETLATATVSEAFIYIIRFACESAGIPLP